MTHHLILGAGPAGVIAAETLRRHAGAQDRITLVGDEPEPPYSRMAIPYLLIGHIDEAGTHLRKSPTHFADLGIERMQARASRVDAAGRRVTFEDGRTVSFDTLLIATGSTPVQPPVPGIDAEGVFHCWTLADAREILQRAKPGARVLQLGAGFIGCIIMEALHAMGVQLTVVEMGDRMVPRMMTPTAGNMIKDWVETKGVTVRTGAGVDRVDDGSGTALAVHLSTGEVLPADLLIVAAGVAPNADFLAGTGVEVGRGIRVNLRQETNVKGIYAAGDVAEGPDFFTGEPTVSAIQPNAADQGRIAALNMAGQSVELPGVQAFNVLDTLGLISSSFGQWWGGADKDGIELVDKAGFRYLSLQFAGDVLIGATSIGLTQHVGALRGLIQNRVRLGHWKETLRQEPLRFAEAYVACSQQSVLLN